MTIRFVTLVPTFAFESHNKLPSMGGWKLESARFLILVGFPVASFWAFNQPGVFDYFMKSYKLPHNPEAEEKIKVWKEGLMEKRRKREYEKFLREEMAFEEARRLREQNNI
ncbi:hypothetical protein M3Y98_00559800 [Aphelenchoides besseyi]|nr:hypothetical protein M3Y98_00559800 [Aphelenchoides besseyi]